MCYQIFNMTTRKQIKANQENGKKWWVKTQKWKKISKYNAYSYWLTANKLLDEKENMKYDFILHILKEEFEN